MVAELRDDIDFELEVVDIDGDAELEARFRALLPVIQVDGEIAFTYFVDLDALRERLESVPPAGAKHPQAES